jgi:hypothetical protein
MLLYAAYMLQLHSFFAALSSIIVMNKDGRVPLPTLSAFRADCEEFDGEYDHSYVREGLSWSFWGAVADHSLADRFPENVEDDKDYWAELSWQLREGETGSKSVFAFTGTLIHSA